MICTFLAWFNKFSFFRFTDSLLTLNQIDTFFSSVFSILAKQSFSANKINCNIIDALITCISLM